ncbi:DUF5673 domain-containing protein [Oceanirhabdus seepicola]|uniref:DUF5673 domain-containing protein n=1 Tax=Oceanirhabdus seepicola TaxID=2828781 RepID=A0A9J6NY38_9CLOT|nr:DUF5673 domain-containing protein [Oceanirhabdus seepicola]MCM1989179.1 hypothetical protein [Oceanirhabdus seepicola]
MFTIKIIFSIGMVVIAGILLYNNKKTKARLGTNMYQGKVKTKSTVKLLFGVVLALVALTAIIGAVKSGLNDGTVFSMSLCFYICCLLYMEHNNFIISRSGIMYNNLAVSWEHVESYEWNDNKLNIVLRIPSRLTHGVVTVENKQKKEIDRLLKKYMKK